jgi:hypothetical protein
MLKEMVVFRVGLGDGQINFASNGRLCGLGDYIYFSAPLEFVEESAEFLRCAG